MSDTRTPSLIQSRETCQEVVNRGDHRWSKREACGRPVKEDGLCGMHLGVKRRRAEKDKKWRENRDRGKALQAEADEIGAALGTHVSAHYSSIRGEYDGRFVVDADWLRSQVTG